MNDTLHTRIARRLKSRRETLGLSQEDVSRLMNFNNRQTLAAIENGRRRIRPEELVLAARALDVEPDFFTDPYVAAGEAAFSFRATDGDEGTLADFESQAGRWLATYLELGEEEGKPISFLAPSLALSPRSSYEDAVAAADDVRRGLGLGKIPTTDLEPALQREWGLLVLYVDPPAGISGAASRMRGLHAILVNRNESPGRRHFDLAHELFHLLTWDAMPPRRVDAKTFSGRGAGRVEGLADNFAAALLMPTETIRNLWNDRDQIPLASWMTATAAQLGVSGPALKWRMHNLGLVSRSGLPTDAELADAARGASRYDEKPLPFNASFVHRMYTGVESGRLSLRKASRLLSLDTTGFAALCEAYGRRLSYEV